MARTMTRPTIEIEHVYLGKGSMLDIFVRLLVAGAQKDKNPNRTFEGVKQPQYNSDTDKFKEVS